MKPSKVKTKKSRNNPLPETIQRIKGYPDKLIFYRVPCSQYWWARVYLYGRYHFKSLKTDNETLARKRCIEFFNEKLAGTVGKGSIDKRKFASVGNECLDLNETEGTKRRNYDDRNRFKKELVPFFGNLDIGEVSNAKIMEFLKTLKNRGLKPPTIKHYILVLRKILRYAADNQIIDALPNFPRLQGSKSVTKRDFFELDEYKHLCTVADELAKEGALVRGIPITEELKLLMQFMVNSFLRPSDLRVLKHEHIKVMENKNAKSASEKKFLLLSHPKTKTTDQEVVTMPAAFPVYQTLLKLQKKRDRKDGKTGKYGQASDYVFFPEYPNRTTMMGILSRQFRKLIESAEITQEGEQHTLYSLRHTAIMYRLRMGNVDTITLARNCRTSVAMIDRFYASRLTALMNLDKLHSFV